MKAKKILAVLLVLAMTVAMFTACGTKDKGNSNNNDNGSTNQTSDNGDSKDTNDSGDTADLGAYPGTPAANEITVNITSEPPEMFTVTTTDTTSFTVIRHVIENLVMLDANDEVTPGVAKDWTVSDDGLTYTFNLRDDMKWTNGEPVTAHDFVFAWKSLLNPEFAADYAYFGFVFKNGLKFYNGEVGEDELGFKALSDYELEVTLENPTSFFLSQLAFGVFAPVNEKAYNEFGDAYGTDADKMVYNGAFVMDSWEHESKIVLKKNPEYWNADAIKLDAINMVMINDTNAAMNAFKAGEVDVIGVNGDQAEMMRGEGYPVLTYDDGATFYLEYNLNDPYLKNKNLRKALTYAVDKQAFVDAIVKNSSKAAVSFTAPAINGLNDKFADEVGALIPVLDVDKAKEYYAAALEELGVDTIELTMIADDSDTAIENAAFIQEQLRVNLGLEIKVENMPFKSRLERMSNKDFSIVFAGWGPDYNDPQTFLDMWETGNGNNHTSYTSADYDALLAKVRTELDPAKRMGYLMDMEKMLMDDMPIGPIYWRSRDYIVSGKIDSGVIRTAFQDMNYRYVTLK
jgi:oligopeptide transport system substrate-binding protein